MSISTLQLPDSLHDLPIQLDSHRYSLFIIHIWKSDLHLIWNYFLKLRKENILSAIPLTKGPIVFWPWLPVFMDQGDSRWFKRAHYAMTQDDSRWPTMTYWGLLRSWPHNAVGNLNRLILGARDRYFRDGIHIILAFFKTLSQILQPQWMLQLG